MLGISRRGSVIAAALAGLAMFATAANADIVYNTLDNTIDSELEAMNLVAGGPAGTATLRIQVQGHEANDHAGCNIQGGAHYIALAAASDSSTVTVAFRNEDARFDKCSDTVLVDVTPLTAGSANITFSIDKDKTSNDPALTFDLAQAAFHVNIAPADPVIVPVETGCDVDPAAPAW